MLTFLLALCAPFIGGILYGIERKLKARMQQRQGPPLLQPFYDCAKLFVKENRIIHSFHAQMAIYHFLAVWLALLLLLCGYDLFLIIFTHVLATLFLIIGALSVPSPYSKIGAMRELFQMLIYEPLFIAAILGFHLFTNSFSAESIWQSEPHLLPLFPLFITVFIASMIKLKKNPFSAAEAHQEIIGGAEIEYGGIFYEFLYTAKWLDLCFVLVFLGLFGGNNPVLIAAIIIFSFFMMIFIEVISARMTGKTLLRFVAPWLFLLAITNLLGVFLW